jgi:hypothetical protein
MWYYEVRTTRPLEVHNIYDNDNERRTAIDIHPYL